jgi:hypothetical protein
VGLGQLAVDVGVGEIEPQRVAVAAAGGVDELAVEPRRPIGEGRLGVRALVGADGRRVAVDHAGLPVDAGLAQIVGIEGDLPVVAEPQRDLLVAGVNRLDAPATAVVDRRGQRPPAQQDLVAD